MKKTLFFFLLLGMILQCNAQVTISEEIFESITYPDLPAGWTTVDRSNDTLMLDWKGGYDIAGLSDPWGFSGKIALKNKMTCQSI
ncbi:hypothetical protein [Chryseobacterium sp. PMSZPI]|uniref:hypothetical protein n=1 Tax=Chryseobacterium sp. PMSZPI TaxID=1033900 RepID=UPI000C342C48|nr:hypothetical protein [Chryseobacterium sp. PMSZPI]PKF75875.1 hypothetical protein CW752_02180 [Chryseobacterium sp. PMSZPI]